jgi:hypothetical protein
MPLAAALSPSIPDVEITNLALLLDYEVKCVVSERNFYQYD